MAERPPSLTATPHPSQQPPSPHHQPMQPLTSPAVGPSPYLTTSFSPSLHHLYPTAVPPSLSLPHSKPAPITSKGKAHTSAGTAPSPPCPARNGGQSPLTSRAPPSPAHLHHPHHHLWNSLPSPVSSNRTAPSPSLKTKREQPPGGDGLASSPPRPPLQPISLNLLITSTSLHNPKETEADPTAPPPAHNSSHPSHPR